jgi:hypothetical protein
MTPKPLAVFTADFPDDQVADVRDVVLLGGRSVALAIRQLVSDGGCEVSGLDYDSLKGWVFDARYKGEVFDCLTTSFYPKFFFDIGKPNRHKRETCAEFWAIIDGALRDDGRFHDVRWYSLEDAPDPWEDETEQRKPVDLGAIAAHATQRKAQRRRRRYANLARGFGCGLTVLAFLMAIFALFVVVGGLAEMIGGAPHGGGQIANGLLVFAVSSLVFVVFGYLWTGQSRKRTDSAP